MAPVQFDDAAIVDDARALFSISAASAMPDGLVCEFGVRSGGSTRHIVREFGPGVYGFDSFEGLPEDWNKSASVVAPAGWFSAIQPDIDGAEMIAGWFADTVPDFFAKRKEPIRFAHIDCDLYSATVTVLEAIKPLLVEGSIIQFDELCCFENSNYEYWREGEWKALQESGLSWSAIARTRHEQAVIKINGGK